jgi:hypothetical protein
MIRCRGVRGFAAWPRVHGTVRPAICGIWGFGAEAKRSLPPPPPFPPNTYTTHPVVLTLLCQSLAFNPPKILNILATFLNILAYYYLHFKFLDLLSDMVNRSWKTCVYINELFFCPLWIFRQPLTKLTREADQKVKEIPPYSAFALVQSLIPRLGARYDAEHARV